MLLKFPNAGSRKRLLVGLLLVFGLIMLLIVGDAVSSADAGRAQAVLGLMTTLPLQWSEGGIEADLAKEAQAAPGLCPVAGAI